MDENTLQPDIVGITKVEQKASNPAAWYGPALRKTAGAVAGVAVLVMGVALIFLPAPSVLVIPLGLAILAREVAWAKRLRDWSKDRVRRSWVAVRDQFAKLPRL